MVRLIFLALLLIGCGSESEESNESSANKQSNGLAFIAYDRSSSVQYDSLEIVTMRKELFSGLNALFLSETGYEVIAVHEITANSSVIPRYIEFTERCKADKNGNIMEKSEYADCMGIKKQWIRFQVDRVMTDIQKVPSARATDVFGLFRSVNEALRSGKSGGGRTEVFVFSDLINTAGNLKPVDLKNGKDAAKMAETVFSRLESGKMIKRLEPGNDVRFTIFNPDKNVVKGPYLEFWNQFLQLWGVRAEHIQWR